MISRHKKIIRHSIAGITKAALQRIAYTAGVTSMSGLVYEELRGILKAKMENILYKSINYTEYQRKITVDEYAIASSISPKMWSIDPKAKSCGKRKSRSRSRSRSGSRRRKSPGFDALKQVNFYQRRYDCLNIPMTSFARLCKEIAMDFKTNVRFSKKALIIFQYSIENYLIEILKKSLLLTIHANRTRIEVKDIILARAQLKEII